MSNDKLIQIQELVDNAMSSLKTAYALLRNTTGILDIEKERIITKAEDMPVSEYAGGKIVEGIFDGQNMVDSKGKTYPVPANYASKSKLVENDGMKLTISDEGKFIYKQISPIERKTIAGVLIQEDGQYKVLGGGKAYRVLLASVTFYRAEVGDQVTILVPKDEPAIWGAIENVLPKHMAEAAAVAKIKEMSVSEEDEDGEMKPFVD